MVDYFKDLRNKLNNNNVKIIESNIIECSMNHTFDMFEFGISDEVKFIYNNYKKFILSWEETVQNIRGFINFVPYEEIMKENRALSKNIENLEEDLIEEQNIVIDDLLHWYPIFKFPNGDAFCYDKRNGKIVFFEHDVFDTGINLHGLVIAESIDSLLKKWSKILFIDIYDWYEGVNEQGIDLDKCIYRNVLDIFQN